MARAYLAMGSNLGDRQKTIDFACAAMAGWQGTQLLRTSTVYETMPVGGPVDQGPYLNAVAEIDTMLDPRDLIAHALALEVEAGRQPRDRRLRWAARELDIDLLLYDEVIMDEPGLTIPHPRLHERWFVLKPMTDLAPLLIHPLLKRSMIDLLLNLPPQPPHTISCNPQIRGAP